MEITHDLVCGALTVKLFTLKPGNLFIYHNVLYVRQSRGAAMEISDHLYMPQYFDGENIDVYRVTELHATCV